MTDTVPVPKAPREESLHLDFSAISDVGRVRKDNQDSGYAGPWLLTVCDGVGGAARGDIASGTAVQQIRRLDEAPSTDLLGSVAGAIVRASDKIGEIVEDDPALNGTSTTATVAAFDGSRLGIGHLGDSRAYLLRSGQLTQLTKDHTFVQSLIDEGRISEEEARTHPHRNLILKALDGVHDVEPDLFIVEVAAGDRIFLCSDGACGSLTDPQLAEILTQGTPDWAAVELTSAALDAGSTDNVTCVVADVVTGPATDAEPLLVGAAADLPRRLGRGRLFRGRPHDTGELEPVDGLPADVPFAISSDPIDPETARYAPRAPGQYVWLRRLLAMMTVIGLLWIIGAAAWHWTQQQYFVGEHDGVMTVYRGINADIPGIPLSEPYQKSNVDMTRLSDIDAAAVKEGITADSLTDARQIITDFATRNPDQTAAPSPSPSSSAGTPTASSDAPTTGPTDNLDPE